MTDPFTSPLATAQLIASLNSFLNVDAFTDYAPQGLQIAGRDTTKKIVTAVTASLKAIEFAAERGADMLLVHHGLFWRGEPEPIVGWKHERVRTLLLHDINLVTYHLPLDAHPIVGNNIQLAKRLGWQFEAACGPQNLIFVGAVKKKELLQKLREDLARVLRREPLVIGDLSREIKKIAWCTGAGQDFFLAAAALGVDAFITGEASEAQYHYAHETGVAFISAGHFATERFGIEALGEWCKNEFSLEVTFFDEDNPI